MTTLELSDHGQRQFNSKVKKRLFWIEKVLQLFAGVLYMLVNGKIHGDWVPSIAELLIKVMRMGP